jgi:hypothetical protein
MWAMAPRIRLLALLLVLPTLPACLDWSDEAAQGNWLLCRPCEHSDDCGGPDDLCLKNSANEQFCGKDCSKGQECPEGYTCHGLIKDNTIYQQCAPVSGRCTSR